MNNIFIPEQRLEIYEDLLKSINEVVKHYSQIPWFGMCHLICIAVYGDYHAMHESTMFKETGYQPYQDQFRNLPEIRQQLTPEQQINIGYIWEKDLFGWHKRKCVVEKAIELVKETIFQNNKTVNHETAIQTLI